MTDRRRFVFVIAFCAAAFVLGSVPLVLSGDERLVSSPPECPSKDLRLLVIAADGEDSALPAIRQVLDYLGTPYTVHVASQSPGSLTQDKLSSGCRAHYQGILLTTGDLSYETAGGNTRSALTDAEWQALREYEAKFDVRRVAWYAYPTPEYGLQNPSSELDTSKNPIEAEYTEAGQDVFSYANTDNPLTVEGVSAYPAEPAGGSTTPLLTDERGGVLAAVAEHPDGRETLALAFASNVALQHNLVLDYGLITWVTRGLFIGEPERPYLSAQIDDLFIPNVIYGTENGKYRITDDDLQAVLAWQRKTQEQPTTERLRLDMAFNAYGTTGIYSPDALTPAAKRHMDEFKWISHTYKHLDWDELDQPTALAELRDNNAWAEEVGLEGYEEENLVTPEISGLENPAAMRAASEAGVRYLVSDASRPEWDNPSPNAGFPHPLEPSILVIPRYPNNLGFDVSTPEEWTEQYNDRYRDTWGENLDYEEILDKESEVLLSYLLKGDIDPWMFHQANLRAYDGEHTLLGDLLDATLEKYDALFEVPILSPTQDEVGRKMAERTRYNEAGVEASVVPGESITLTARKAARIPVTGLRIENAELYDDQPTSYVSLEAGGSVTLPLE
ncbi:MAG: hypothetical protein AVDCRST_MAG22-1483 [uncultured Rubrobacteraceae bacterium]|uniref:NodB homology domain-containing protein n=1 Tax=uncultured Rubrobacteraceae bacterium TaxID=349277 RepID=A0A6J4P9Y6_9ACTN|nr:MAG: hypothetical protein AVDCRST_MAG22-1483 [uncultured Rubrobacteraceae bacterium]